MRRRPAVMLPDAGNDVVRLRMDDIYGGMVHARATQQDASVLALAASIARHGLLQPIVVRKNAQAGRYAVICGARRVLACRILGMKEIDAIVIDADEATSAACFLEEHALRRDAHFLEEAELIDRVDGERVMEECTLERRGVQKKLTLLGLDERVLACIRREGLTAQQAWPLTAIGDADRQLEAASIIAERGLTGDQARRLVLGPRREEIAVSGRRRLLRAATEAAEKTARMLKNSGIASHVSVQSQEQGVSIQILIRNAKNRNWRQEKSASKENYTDSEQR